MTTPPALDNAPHPYLSREYPLRFAHRGSRVLWPENTEMAFQGAVDLGYLYIETDLQLTRDDVVVVFHDDRLERITNGAGKVKDWRYEELRLLDAAYRFRADEEFPYRGTGVTIPTLADVLVTWPDISFNLDLKAPNMEWHVADLIKGHRREDTTLVAGLWGHRTARFRRITAGEVATSAGAVGATSMWAASRLGRTVSSEAVAYQLPFEYRLRLDARLVRSIHDGGAQVHAWTVNHPDDMNRLLDIGVDGIVTDRPDLLNRVVEARRGD